MRRVRPSEALPQVANEANRQRNTASVPLNIKSNNALLIVKGAFQFVSFIPAIDFS